MYRIEVKPGEENVFRTIEELATAIRNGLVTPRARIFHGASQKWLPIEFHPHYKKALNMPPTKSGETPAVVVTSAPAPSSIFTPKPSPAPVFTPPPVAAPVKAAPVPVVVAPVVAAPVKAAPIVASPAVMSPVVELPTIDYPETTPVDTLLPVGQDKRARGPIHRSPLVIGAAAAVLLAGTYVALSGAMPAHQAAPDNAPAPASTPAAIEMPAPPKPAAEVTASTSGPTFGPPSTPPVASKHPIVTSIGASPAAPVAGNAAAAIEPAPADVDLSVPSLPSGDSLAPKVQADSNAIRRILRAVGGKGEPAPHP